MTNAREEFLGEFAKEIEAGKILCAKIIFHKHKARKAEERTIILRKNFSKEHLKKFLSELNFEYDRGFGSQELFGTVWGVNNWWAVREEYDGSEWWAKLSYPVFPPELQ